MCKLQSNEETEAWSGRIGKCVQTSNLMQTGVTLRGWFYKPDSGKGPFPTVVMAHGFTATKEMTLDQIR